MLMLKAIQFTSSGSAEVHKGRFFTETDRSRNVVVVSQTVAKSLWPGEDPIGKTCVTTWGGFHPNEVIGVVGDIRTVRLDAPPPLMVYLPHTHGEAKPDAPGSASVVLRTYMAPRASEQAVRDLIRRIDPEIPVVAVRPVTEVVSESVEGRRFQTILASLGIFGVIAYSVEQRRHELGIRMALGAEVSDLRRLVLWQGMTPVAVGLASGLGSRFLPDA